MRKKIRRYVPPVVDRRGKEAAARIGHNRGPSIGYQPQPKGEGGRLIGYARVSTPEQDVDMQLQMLRNAGVHEDNLHWETVSGVAKRRHKLELAMIDARAGDTLVVYKLDRLARSMRDLLYKVAFLEDQGIGFCSLTDQFDTSTPTGRLHFHMLAAFAQFERDLTVARTSDGMKAAKARGAQVGKPLWFTEKRRRAFERWIRRGKTVAAWCERYDKSRQIIYGRYSAKDIEKLRKSKD